MKKKIILLLCMTVLFSAAAFCQEEADATQENPPAAGPGARQRTAPAPAQQAEEFRYRIIDVKYEITGATQQYALALNVPVDTDRFFETEDELQEYADGITQELMNLRVIARAEISYSFLEPAGGVIPVIFVITTVDTFNLIIVPYPKYDSNDGLDLRFKLKNYNFFGLMQTLTADVIYKWELNNDTGKNDHTFGAALNFDLPFKVSIFDAKWLNDYSLSYTIGQSKPEFSAMTGIELTLPFDAVSLVFTAKQRVNLNFDYTVTGDELYFTEEASIAVPIEIAEINSWTKVKLIPDVHFAYNWDADGLSPNKYVKYSLAANGLVENDLLGPTVGAGYKLASSRVNWLENYRNGFSFEVGQKFDFNYHEAKQDFMPSVWAEFEAYKAFKYLSFNSRLYLFAKENDTEEIGSRLRGIRDDQTGSKTSLAFVANFDLPVKVLQTHWRDWGCAIFKKEMPGWFDWLDFEMQLSPFIDIALSHIGVPAANVNRTFNYKDGWYAGGIEVLIYPTKMRSLQGRVSFGVDIARTLGFIESKIDTTWHDSVSRYELFIGIGLFY